MRINSSNPALNRAQRASFDGVYEKATYVGVGLKLLYFIGMTILGAGLGIFLLYNNPEMLIGSSVIGIIITVIFAIAAMSSPKLAKICGPIFCIIEGSTIGVISLFCEALFPGIVVTAFCGTISIVLVVGILYTTGLVKVGSRFTRFLLTFAIGFIITMLICLVLSLFPTFADLFNNVAVVMIVSAISLFLATLYLFFDMEQIRTIVESGASKEYEWLVSFGLAYTVIWVYYQVLRLLIILFANNNN